MVAVGVAREGAWQQQRRLRSEEGVRVRAVVGPCAPLHVCSRRGPSYLRSELPAIVDDLPAPVDRRHLYGNVGNVGCEIWGHVTTSQPQWIGVTVWNGEIWMLRRANHMHSDGASLGTRTRPHRAAAGLWPHRTARLWQGCGGVQKAKRRVLALHPVRRPEARRRVVREVVNEAGARHPAHLMGTWWAA